MVFLRYFAGLMTWGTIICMIAAMLALGFIVYN
jgi:hypothetical protein